ncbi:MAG: tetratricopeptide repeat protein [Alphaproteobacteria bacterium]|nr:MAG: tetratricopeptide repeat protein [Alphaproteobacteria bacterium]
MAGKSITLKALRAREEAQVPPRLGVRIVAVFIAIQLLLLAALLLVYPASAGAAPVRGEVAVSTKEGYARLVFTLAEESEADIRLNNGILVIAFKQTLDLSVDRIPVGAPNYVGAARVDPDGSAVRLALNRKVTVNSMAAGEKLFVDLLPEGWTGLPPGLPQEVVEDLARRAREAEKKARQQLAVAQQRALPPVRVRVGIQPTFTRYTFALPSLIAVSHDRADDRMTFTFEAPLKFDLADAQATLPPTVAAIDARTGADNISVRFDFIGKVDVRTFREDNNYFIDVVPIAPRGETAAEPGKSEPSALAAALNDNRAATAQPAPRASEKAQAPPVKAAAAASEEKPATAPAAVVASKAPAERMPLPEPSDPPATIPAREAQDVKLSPADPAAPVVVDVRRQGEALRLTFPFVVATPAAVFRRADTIWLVFDSQAPIDINKITAQSGRSIRNAAITRSRDGQIIQLKLDKPKLTSIGAEGLTWSVVVGDTMLEPTQPLSVVRVGHTGGRASATIPFDAPSQLHRLADADVGDTLLVVTALGPARGFLKPQEFVEFNALVSTHGVVIQPRADDVVAEVNNDKIVVTRPGGLTLSSAGARAVAAAPAFGANGPRGGAASGLFVLDPQTWGFDREGDFRERQAELTAAAASADESQRTPARVKLARFYLARELTAEAKGVLDSTASDQHTDGSPLLLRAVANVMLGRGTDAVKDLSHASLANRSDAALWRALALAQQGKWAEAREGFRSLATAAATLPVELQRRAFLEALRAAVEVRDFGAAQSLLNEFETLQASAQDADLAVLKGRIMEGLGRLGEGLTFYHAAAQSPDRPAAARGALREIALRHTIGGMKRGDAITALETLTTSWRGDETEAEGLQLLGRLYAEENRYRDTFQVMRTALIAHPQSEMTRRIQDDCALTFESLFLGGKSETMAPIDALSLFYDFRDLTPVGRRGDEMIRKLADRLVSVDLLDQAAELLQHQVDNRLQGAARSQVAVRLAVIYLMGRKPDRALQVLRTSRSGDLPTELRSQRLLIEARAQSDVGRPELALEVIANLQGAEVERLRADILWKARHWRDAAEQIEKLHGERWNQLTPLSEQERADVLRAAVGYALAEDSIGLDRLRTKYMPKMAAGPDRRAFEVVTSPLHAKPPEFGDVAKVVAAADTLDAFLRDIRAKYPETTGPVPGASPAPAVPGPGAAAETKRAS